MKPGKNLIKSLIPALCCMLTIVLAACGGNGPQAAGSTGPTKAPDAKQILVEAWIGAAIRTIDPPLVPDEGSVQNAQMVFTGLVQVDDKLNIRPEIASSYELSADSLTWTFHLKPNLKFSDGTPLTSQDVVYSIDRAFDPALKSPNAAYYLGLIKDSDKRASGKATSMIGDGLLAPDPLTVKINLSQKAAYFLDALTFPTGFVVEKKIIDKYGNDYIHHLNEGGSSGPWIISKEDTKGVEFVPNPNYYGPHPQLKKYELIYYPQADVTWKAYQTGQLDASGVPSAQLATARALPNGQYHQVPQLWTDWLYMNYLAKPFDNIKIRQAFELAIDKTSLAHNIWKDTLQPTNHIIPKGQPGYDTGLTGPDGTQSTSGNPTKAKELFTEGLQEEGMTLATMPTITFSTSSQGSADVRNEAAALQQMWQTALGVSVKITDVEYSKFLSDGTATLNNPKGLMLWENGWVADYPDPQDWTTLQFDKGSSQNTSNYGQNNSTDAAAQVANQHLMEQADANPDNTSRMQQYNQVEQQLVNDVDVAPLYQVLTSGVRKPCEMGRIDNPQGGPVPPDDWGQVYISTATPCADTSQYQ